METRVLLLAPFEEIFEELAAAGQKNRAVILNMHGGRLEQAMQQSLARVTEYLLPDAAVSRSPQFDNELRPVRSACAEWIRAKDAIEQENIPEGFFETIVHGFTDPSIQKKAAVGAAIGSIVPGIGNLFGTVVGAFMGGLETGTRSSSLLSRFYEAADHLRQTLVEAHPVLLEIIATENHVVFARLPTAIHANRIEVESMAELITVELEGESPNFADCVQIAERCIELLPEESTCHTILGGLRTSEGNLDAAIDAFRAAVDAGPTEIDNWFQMVEALKTAERHEEMIEWLDSIAGYWPDEPDALKKLAEGYLNAGRLHLAKSWAERALLAASENSSVLQLSARIEAGLENFDTAAELLVQLVSISLTPIDEWRALLGDSQIKAALEMAPAAGLLRAPLDYERLAALCLGEPARSDAFLNQSAPANKIRAARETFLRTIPDSEAILWYYDSTIFGSGSDGIAITARRIAWKELLTSSHVMTFARIEALEINDADNLVIQGPADSKICVCADRLMAESLFRMLSIVCAVCSAPVRH